MAQGHAHPRSNHARKVTDVVGSKDANSSMASSWRRCVVLHNLDPDNPRQPKRLVGERLAAIRAINQALTEEAKPHLDHLLRVYEETDYKILLSDRTGVVIDERLAGVRDVRNHDREVSTLEQWTGIDFSEGSEGTNAIGTCLVEKRPLRVVPEEHFYTRNTGMACSSAPIFNATGDLAGCIDISRPARVESETTDKVIMLVAIENARRIEIALFRRAFPHCRLTLVPDRHGHSGMLLAIDANDLVVGATHAARQALGLSPQRMSAPFPATDLWLSEADQRNLTLADLERRMIQQALARYKENISAAARALGISRGTLHRKMASWRF